MKNILNINKIFFLINFLLSGKGVLYLLYRNRHLRFCEQNNSQAIQLILSKYVSSFLNQNYLSSQITIPKNIFQTQKSQDYVNNNRILKNCQKSWKETDYKYHFYSDSKMCDFIKNNFSKDVYKAFNLCPVPVMKADLWRYCVIYHYGGIYSDLDTILKTNIDIFEKKALFVGTTESTHFLCNYCFAAPKGSPILKEIIDLSVQRILEYDFSKRYEHYIHFLTGPECMTDGFEIWLDKMNLPILKEHNLVPLYKNYKFKNLLYIYDIKLFDKYVTHKEMGSSKEGWKNNRFEPYVQKAKKDIKKKKAN